MKFDGQRIEDSLATTNLSFKDCGTNAQPTRNQGEIVFEKEPKSNNDPFHSVFQGMSNAVLTPHIGGSTAEAQESIGIDVASKLISFLETGSTTGSLSVPALSLPVQHDAHRLLHIHNNVPGVLSDINGLLSSMTGGWKI